jgi:hypothetical protein
MARSQRPLSYVKARFARVAELYGWNYLGSAWQRIGNDNVATVGHVSLEHNSVYGWKVVQIMNDGGGERVICGSYTRAELDAWFDGMIYAKDETPRERL